MSETADEPDRAARSEQSARGSSAEGSPDNWLRAELDDDYPLPPLPAPRPRLTPQPAAQGLQPAAQGLQPAAQGLQPAAQGLQPAAQGLPPAAPQFGAAAQVTSAPLESPLAPVDRAQSAVPFQGPSTTPEVDARQPSVQGPGAHAEQPLPEWVIVLADGVSLPIYGPVVIGRNPSQERFPDASVSAVPDITQTMSKTHARFWADGDRLYVDDLNSTNGVALFPGGNAHGALAVEPGVPAELRSGDVVQLGEYRLSIRRS
ncbi:FHA domain-containing protein [Pseudoclavibacter sp. RFBA6]|uniref:FHA domain-containing protein n=1 Tax=Pseudoclavibacter sp. RFBA6 TaxID=2080573 RepID=UPI0011B07596|nr:FHA domain-containing protein [Pseudoclavibacter sp. RFBA6]